jgi:hypothetical protein
MRPIETGGLMVAGAVVLGLAIAAGPQAGETPASNARLLREPGVLEVSAADQSDWLDENLPKLLSYMAASPEVRTRIAGSLAATKASPASLTPLAAGLAPGDLERLSALVHAAVADNPRYSKRGVARPNSGVTVMPQTHIVRVEITYPAPPASEILEPGPLTFDVWVCPDRETALALYWCRRGGSGVLGALPDAMKKTILNLEMHYAQPEIAADQHPPGESACWIFPRLGISVELPKGHEPMPKDRLSLVRGNVVVEASTVEYTRRRGEKEWMAAMLHHYLPDVVAVCRVIDNGLDRIARRDERGRTRVVAAGRGPSRIVSVPKPGLMQVSAVEQSDWLDENLPELVAAMATSPEVRSRIHGRLAATKAPPFPITPLATGFAPNDLERLTALVNAAVAGSARYGQGASNRPRPAVTVMPRTQVVRVEMTYPAPQASKDFEPGPLTIGIWTCPDRETALALFWLRKGGTWLVDTGSDDALKRSVVETGFPVTTSEMAEAEDPPGELAYRFNPRLAISMLLPKGHEPMPADRLSFVRGNIVVEASTVEFNRRHGEKEWLAWTLRQCAPDVVAVLRAIDSGLVRIAGQEEPGRTGAIGAGSRSSPIPSLPKPVLTRSSAVEQTDWLEQNVPKLTDAMATMAGAGARIASPLRLEGKAPPPYPLKADFGAGSSGLDPDDLERLSNLVRAAVASSPRFGLGVKPGPSPTVTVLRETQIVRFEITFPAPPASKDLEPGPLTIDVWVCPYWETAMALFWVRKGADRFLDTRSKDGSNHSAFNPVFPIYRSALDPRFHVPALEIPVDGDTPGESAYWFNPGLAVSLLPSKPQDPTPADRLSFLRGNIVVEASTVEYAMREKQKKWLATDLRDIAPDVVGVLRRIDAGLVRFGKLEKPNGN